MIIKESYQLTATNTDILAAPSRLSAIPRAGVLTAEFSATDADSTNFFTITCQTPEGDTPFEDLIVPYNGYSTEKVLHRDTQLTFSFSAAQGGHFLFSATENGTGTLFIIFTLQF